MEEVTIYGKVDAPVKINYKSNTSVLKIDKIAGYPRWINIHCFALYPEDIKVGEIVEVQCFKDIFNDYHCTSKDNIKIVKVAKQV